MNNRLISLHHRGPTCIGLHFSLGKKRMRKEKEVAVLVWFLLLLRQHATGSREACIPPRCLRIRGGSAVDPGQVEETELERHRLWQACAVACHASYLHGTQSDGDHIEKAKSFLERACMERVPMADTLEALESTEHWTLFSAANSSILIMSWRGTKPHKIEDLIADLDCVQSTARELCEAGGVHSGFWRRATDTISVAKLRSMLLRDTVSKLLLCGHSLGGAVALLNAARLVRSLELLKGSYKVACRDKIRCITFGAPQVADERAARAIESMLPSGALLNFVHLGDIVPKLLLLSPEVASKVGDVMLGVGIGTFALGIETLIGPHSRPLREYKYHPVGAHMFVGDEGAGPTICPESVEARGLLSRFRIGDGIKQHTMKAYELAVRAAISAHHAARSAANSGDPGDCDLADVQEAARGRTDDNGDGGPDRLRAATRIAAVAARAVGASLMGRAREGEDVPGGNGGAGSLELGIGLVNIGIGLFNAYQVSKSTAHRLDKIGGKLEDKMDRVITLLGSSSQRTEEQLSKIGGMLQYQEEAALAEKVMGLQQVWMRCYDAVKRRDEGAISSEVPAMLDAADSLAAFTWARLSGLVNENGGESDYAHFGSCLVTLDLIKALVLSASVQLEGQCVLVCAGKRKGVSFGSSDAVLELLRARVEMLCSHSTLYELGTASSVPLLQYLNLFQALSRQRSLAISTSSSPPPQPRLMSHPHRTSALEQHQPVHVSSGLSARIQAIGALQEGVNDNGFDIEEEDLRVAIGSDRTRHAHDDELEIMRHHRDNRFPRDSRFGAVRRVRIFVEEMKELFDCSEREGATCLTEIPLESLELHAWHAEMRGEATGEYNPRRHSSVSISRLVSSIGAPINSTVGSDKLGLLQKLSLPSYTRRLAADISSALGLAKGDEQVSIKVKHGNWEANVSDDESDDGDVEYRHAVEAEHRVLEGALDYVAPTGVKDEVEREKDGRGEYMCRPGEDIGGRLGMLRGKKAIGIVKGASGWDSCRMHCDGIQDCKAFTYSLFEETCWMHSSVPANGRGRKAADRVVCFHSQRIKGHGGYKTSYPTASAFNSYNCTPGARIDEGKHTHASVYGSNKRGEIVDIGWCQRMCDISSKCAGISISTGAEPRCRVVKAGIADASTLPLSNSEWWTACLPVDGPAHGTGAQGRASGVSLANSSDNVSGGGRVVAAG